MRKLILGFVLLPLSLMAREQELTDKLTKLKFDEGVLAASYCHDYYAISDVLFDLNKNGDPNGSIPKIRSFYGDEFVDNILTFKGNEKKYLKEQFEDCIKKTIETGELQKP